MNRSHYWFRSVNVWSKYSCNKVINTIYSLNRAGSNVACISAHAITQNENLQSDPMKCNLERNGVPHPTERTQEVLPSK